MTETKDRAAEISARLAELSSYPHDGPVSADQMIRYLATQGTILHLRAVEPWGGIDGAETGQFAVIFAAVSALSEVRDADREAAGVLATDIRDHWDDGDMGEWLAEALGTDATEICELASRLASLGAAEAREAALAPRPAPASEEPVPSVADALRASLAPTVPGAGPEVPGE